MVCEKEWSKRQEKGEILTHDGCLGIYSVCGAVGA